jgi:hypothetical protein
MKILDDDSERFLKTEGNFLNLMQGVYGKPTTKVLLNRERLYNFP